MKLRKRGTEESLSFLISILITIMLIVPFILIGYRALVDAEGVERCFTDIVDTVNNLKDGEEKEIICKFHKDYVHMGFDYDDNEIVTYYKSRPGITGFWKSSKRLTYAKPKKACSGAFPDGTDRSDLACLCFCKDPGQSFEEKKKCAKWTKCAQFKGITDIDGFRLWSKSQSGWAILNPANIVRDTNQGYVQVGSENQLNGEISFTTPYEYSVFGVTTILGILIKRDGEQLIICVPDGKNCKYKSETDAEDFGMRFYEATERCRSYKASGCLCDRIAYSLPGGADYHIYKGKDSGNRPIIDLGPYYEDKPENERFVKKNKFFFKYKLCTYDSRRSMNLVSVDKFSLLEKMATSEGYTIDKKALQLIKIGNDVCMVASADKESLKMPQCSKEVVSSSKKPAPAAVPPPPATTPLPTSGNKFKFIMAADTHASSWATRMDRKIVSQIISQSPEFLIIAGDVTSGKAKGDNSKAVNRRWDHYFLRYIFKPVTDANIMITAVPGNHDNYYPYMSRKYRNFWNTHKQPSLEKLVLAGGNYPDYYSFDYKNSHFVMIDTWRPEDMYGAQITWIESDLKEAKGKYDNIFVIGHHPLWKIPCTSYCAGVAKRKELIGLFKDAGIRFYANGHEHYYFKGEHEGVNIVSIGPSSYTRNYGSKKQVPSVAIVNVDGKKVNVEDLTYNGGRLDPASIRLTNGYAPLDDPYLS